MDNWVLDAVTKITCALIVGFGIGWIIAWIAKQLKSGPGPQRPPRNDLPREYPNEPKSEDKKEEIDEYHIWKATRHGLSYLGRNMASIREKQVKEKFG